MYWITGILGLAFAAAPYFFGYTTDTTALWTSLVLGGGVALASLFEGLQHNEGRWEYLVAALAGIGAIAAPFVLGFGNIAAALWTSVGVGIVLAIIGGYELFNKDVEYYA